MGKSTEQLCAELSKQISGDCLSDIFSRIVYSTDASIYQIVPGCVVRPRDAADVCKVVRYANQNRIPIVARGAGSGLAGESLTGGLMLDMTCYMNKILGYNAETETVRCEPGVVLDELNEYLGRFGKKIGPDPSSSNRAVVGGVVANNATGSHSLQFGYIAEHVAKVQAVLADGELVEIGNGLYGNEADGRLGQIVRDCYELIWQNSAVIDKALPATNRNRSGYNIAGLVSDGRIDMAKILAGSEGTLAVFTEITLQTVDVPRFKGLVQLEFDSLEKMARAVPIVVDCGAVACELMDGRLIRMAREAFEEYRDLLKADSVVSLLVEHVGQTEDELRIRIDQTIAKVGELAYESMQFFDEQAQKRLWRCRKDAVPLLSRVKGPKRPIPFIEDVSVDNLRLAEYVSGLGAIEKRYDVDMTYYGHAGDGELHIRPYLDLSDKGDLEKMTKIANDVFTLAWSLGGSISGEHADGLVRAAFVKRQYGEDFYKILQRVKQIFDPENVLNPGKIINEDAEIMTKNLRTARGVPASNGQTELLFDKDEFDFELIQCSGCGVCRGMQSAMRMCPVFRAMGEEIYSSRAKINLLSAWATGMISDKDFDSEQFGRILGSCINCKMCSVECPSGVDVSKMIAEARARRVKKSGLTVPAMTLVKNRFMGILAGFFAPLSNWVMSLGVVKYVIEKVLGIDRRREMPKFRRSSFLKKAAKFLASAGPISGPIDKIAYFTDTYANYNDHDLGFAVIKVLRHNNIEVIVPKQRPVPLPAVVYGDVKTSRKDFEYNIASLAQAVRDGYKIVCSEPSAALCLKEDVRFFVDSDEARLVSGNTFELLDYLRALLADGKLKKGSLVGGEKFSYHLPCHSKALGYSGAAVELLRQVAGANIANLDSGCCGIAGTFGMQKKNYALSMKIGAKLAEAIEQSGGDVVATECSTCKMQIEHLTGKTVVHPVKLLAKAYGLI